MKIKSILLASTVAIAGISGAQAADAIVYEEPAPVVAAPVFSWTGGYLGGQVGYGWGKSRFDTDGFDLGNVKPDGFLGGLYAGYNFDLGNSVVLGID
ncbi:autotransporter outer membrane beta-barrel domain-containing protein, partial [Brucella sp. NBRC 12950]|uniref:autotransporter outer membrane beta-barrel domain-containing protein n=1 Tax=Brucella sp. NBRC 12950 TaxID=2994518 RepID=UPI002554912B